jgi:hypothetical protein
MKLYDLPLKYTIYVLECKDQDWAGIGPPPRQSS